MRFVVFGAAGSVGKEVVAEALARGHHVTAVVRSEARLAELPAEASARVGDAANVDDVAALSAGHDVAVAATRPAPGQEGELVTTAKVLVGGIAGSGVRLLAVGGAASLAVPGSGWTVLDDPGFPPSLRPIAEACNEQLAVIRASAGVDWTYLSPAAVLEPGERTGRYRLGRDELVVDADGNSTISTADLAVALVDEAEQPRHRGVRFTVGN